MVLGVGSAHICFGYTIREIPKWRGVTAPRFWYHGGVTLAKWSLDKLDEGKYAKLQSKVSVQRNEIARLTMLVEKLMAQRDQLTKDLQWMRGEKNDTRSKS
jgi:hypothetical protein